MIALLQFGPDGTGSASFGMQAEQALRLLAERPGFVRGSLARATDDAGSWLLFTEWESVGAYRRGLGGYQVKLHATPLLSSALDRPSAFEELLSIGPDGSETARASDRADDADWVARHAGGPDQPAG